MRAAIVLAGGRGTRLGGIDKPRLDLGGMSMRARVVAAVREGAGADTRVVVVGDRGAPGECGLRDEFGPAQVWWAREDPPFSGPVAALECGVRELAVALGLSGEEPTPLNELSVLLIGGDMPRIDPRVVRALMAACESSLGPKRAVGIATSRGGVEFLCTAWPALLLRECLQKVAEKRLAAKQGGSSGLIGASVRELFVALGDRVEVLDAAKLSETAPLDAAELANSLKDIDDREALAEARAEFDTGMEDS